MSFSYGCPPPQPPAPVTFYYFGTQQYLADRLREVEQINARNMRIYEIQMKAWVAAQQGCPPFYPRRR